MSTRKMDWEGASRKERARKSRVRQREDAAIARGQMKLAERGAYLKRWATERDLKCFVCGVAAKDAHVADAKTHHWRGPWMICVSCVEKRKAQAAS